MVWTALYEFEWEDQTGITPEGSCLNGVSRYRNVFGYTAYDGQSYDGKCSFFDGEPALQDGLGWFIVVGLGLVFASLTACMAWMSDRRSRIGEGAESEYFTCAGRTIGSGLTATDVVSKWTWAATLLQSCNVAYKFGISGPFWYASGATIQVLLFSILAMEIKRKCPAIHTVLEVVRIRWGKPAHCVFLCFCLGTNLIVTGMLILGGSAVASAVTGVSTHAASFLIPLSVCMYTAFGGLKATYYASWTHTAIIYLALLIFLWKVYVGPSDLGSTNRVWENLAVAAQKNPVEGNSHGSHLTMFSRSGFVFGVINVAGNFGTVFVDQAYWQGAIACRPSATWRGYLLGGMAWFAIPFAMATTLGLAARALDLPVTVAESEKGLLPPAVAMHLLGKSGAFLVALQLLLAVSSTANSEQLAAATLLTYDVYKLSVNPRASGQRLVFVSRCGVVAWALLSGVFAVVLWECNISLDWLYKAMGNFVGSAVAPICMALLWRDCTAGGAIAGALGGFGASMLGWVACAAAEGGGRVTVATLGRDHPMLVGNLLALLVSPAVAWAVSTAQGGQRFAWGELEAEAARLLVEEDGNAQLKSDESQDSRQALERAYPSVVRTAVGLTFALLVGWPVLSLPMQTFSRAYFAWWVALAFIWAHAAAFITVIYPVWEVRKALMAAFGLQSASNDMDVRLDIVSRMHPGAPAHLWPEPEDASQHSAGPRASLRAINGLSAAVIAHWFRRSSSIPESPLVAPARFARSPSAELHARLSPPGPRPSFPHGRSLSFPYAADPSRSPLRLSFARVASSPPAPDHVDLSGIPNLNLNRAPTDSSGTTRSSSGGATDARSQGRTPSGSGAGAGSRDSFRGNSGRPAYFGDEEGSASRGSSAQALAAGPGAPPARRARSPGPNGLKPRVISGQSSLKVFADDGIAPSPGAGVGIGEEVCLGPGSPVVRRPLALDAPPSPRAPSPPRLSGSFTLPKRGSRTLLQLQGRVGRGSLDLGRLHADAARRPAQALQQCSCCSNKHSAAGAETLPPVAAAGRVKQH